MIGLTNRTLVGLHNMAWLVIFGEIIHIIRGFIKSEFWGGWPIDYKI